MYVSVPHVYSVHTFNSGKNDSNLNFIRVVYGNKLNQKTYTYMFRICCKLYKIPQIILIHRTYFIKIEK